MTKPSPNPRKPKAPAMTPREQQRTSMRARKYPWAFLVAGADGSGLPLRVGQWWLTECRQISRGGWRRIQYKRLKPAQAGKGRYALTLAWNGERLAGGSDSRDLERYPALRRAVLRGLLMHDSTECRNYWRDMRREIEAARRGEVNH